MVGPVFGAVLALAFAAVSYAADDNVLEEVVITAVRTPTSPSDQSRELDQARAKQLLPSLGATAYAIDAQAIEALPGGEDTPLDRVVVQVPGVSADSALSGPDFHIRNEYANVQYRLNGIRLPDGVSALGEVLDTSLVEHLEVLDGALPAQYGQRTAGVIDITTRSTFDRGGSLNLYAGSWDTLSPSLTVGGSTAGSQYFLSARYLQSAQGLENALPTVDPIHDRTTQQRLFGYGSTLVGDSSRLSVLAGEWVGEFQIPNVLGLAPLGDFGPTNLSSASLKENETDRFYFGLLALQTHDEELDTQLALFTRSASVKFFPDVDADLAFDDVASAVDRESLASGFQFDAARRLGSAHTLRGGLEASFERTKVDDRSTVLPLGVDGVPLPTPRTLNDVTSKLGSTLGGYIQDAWTLGPGWILNAGLRFDLLRQFVSASQLSPRVALLYSPSSRVSLHAGVSRYFTPPIQAEATPTDLALFRNTTQQPAVPQEDPVRPERATYYDLGGEIRPLVGLTLGLDAYYKDGRDVLDDGQFGQAVVLDQLNYARGFSRGLEGKIGYEIGSLRTYANLADEVTQVVLPVSNQYLFSDPIEFEYVASHYIHADDAQRLTASAGASWRWHALQGDLDAHYGSGLSSGFANLQHGPGYVQWNAGAAREFSPWANSRPLTVRLSVVNLFDRRYLLRSGTGIGQFAPQYGTRRGFGLRVSQRF
jgi:outer membrane receptor protein involved in Fe transport